MAAQRGKPRRRRAEDSLQRACMTWAKLHERRLGFFCFHVPNGGQRTLLEAKIFRGLGVRDGVADVILILPGGGFGAIELKTQGGKLTPAQEQFAETAEALGAHYVVCRGLEEFIETVTEWVTGSRAELIERLNAARDELIERLNAARDELIEREERKRENDDIEHAAGPSS